MGVLSQFERQGRTEEASTIWESLTKTHATSYLVWTGWGDFETCVTRMRPTLLVQLCLL